MKTQRQKELNIIYSRTKKGVITQIYGSRKSHSKLRGHRQPEYTKKELSEWLFSQELFHKLHNEWKMSGYKKELKPSVDRKYNNIHYCMNNIQLMTWKENKLKGHTDSKTNKLSTGNKKRAVSQFNKEGVWLQDFISTREAGRSTNTAPGDIISVCKGKQSTAGGFTWCYAGGVPSE